MTLELKIPPPIVLLLCSGLAHAIAQAAPAAAWQVSVALPVAIALAGAGVLLAVLAFFEFQKVKTTVNPLAPKNTTALVTRGVYRFSRNPIYLGDLLILLGWAIYLENLAAYFALPVFVVYINRFQIRPEERALREKFAAQFDAYRARVRAWL